MNDSRHGSPMDTSEIRVPVAICAAHAHLTPAVIEELFCDMYRLHEHSRLVQPTQYAAEETVTLIGPHGRLSNVRIIGPPRSVNQVELSQKDALTLGIDAPVRKSGDLEGTPGILLEGPRTSVKLERGVICALRHVHMAPLDADRLGLKDQDRIEVFTEGPTRRILFRDVLVRVSPDYQLELHLDADDGSAAGLRSGDYVLLSRPHPQSNASVVRRP